MVVLAIPCMAVLASFMVSCAVGSLTLSLHELFATLLAPAKADASLASTLLNLRLARASSAFVTGALLALAYVMMQALLRNPLANHYVPGISGGAAVGTLGAMLLFSAAWIIDVATFCGALLVALLLFCLAHRDLRGGNGDCNSADRSLLLLSGIGMVAGCGTVVTLMPSAALDARLRGMVFWLIGELSGTSVRAPSWVVLCAALLLVICSARSINLSAMHSEATTMLGVPTGRLRQTLFYYTALLTSSFMVDQLIDERMRPFPYKAAQV